jgi:hypothetical protein
LSDSQKICIINVDNEEQMNAFYEIFENSFIKIDGDYYGNTPKLSTNTYERLLTEGGRAYNTEGINTLVPVMDGILNALEIFAPVLPPSMQKWRYYTPNIIALAVRDDLSPGAVWSSPDLKHPYYKDVVEEYERFLVWQKERNPKWPSAGEESLEEHWKSLPIRTITSTLDLRFLSHFKGLDGEVLNGIIGEYTGRLCDFFSGMIAANTSRIKVIQDDYLHKCSTGEAADTLKTLQCIVKKLHTQLPEKLGGFIGYFQDERVSAASTSYGLVIEKLFDPYD